MEFINDQVNIDQIEPITENSNGLSKLVIDNSKKSAVNGRWSNPGAKFYNRLLNSFYCPDDCLDDTKKYDDSVKKETTFFYPKYLKEAYLIAPVEEINNSPYGVTPYSNSRCKYPHHTIKKDKMVVHIGGLKAAYARAKQVGVYSGEIKEHLDRHYEELGLNMNADNIIEENFNFINDYLDKVYYEDADTTKVENKTFVPIFVVLKSASTGFGKLLKKLTRGDNYSHALISLDDSFTKMYSYSDEGLELVNMFKHPDYAEALSLYFTVLFITPAERDSMKSYLNKLVRNKKETKYANENLLKMFIGSSTKQDKRFVCSTITGYLMSMGNLKNLHRDYSKMRPEDFTIIPRSFYIMNAKDSVEFEKKLPEFKKRVKNIYKDNYEEICEYNNQLPKLLLKQKIRKLGTIDKILDWIISKL